jgi:hypothetical protein
VARAVRVDGCIACVRGVRHEVRFRRVPDVLVAAECDDVHNSRELDRGRARVVEQDFHFVRGFLVAIDEHHGPLAIGPLDRVGSDHRMADAIADIANR